MNSDRKPFLIDYSLGDIKFKSRSLYSYVRLFVPRSGRNSKILLAECLHSVAEVKDIKFQTSC